VRGLGATYTGDDGHSDDAGAPIRPALAIRAARRIRTRGNVLVDLPPAWPAGMGVATIDPFFAGRRRSSRGIGGDRAASLWKRRRLSPQRPAPRAASAEAARQLDPRPTVLFLRAVRDDRYRLARGRLPLLRRLSDRADIGGTLEEVIAADCTGGPVVAIGDPTDPLPAARCFANVLEEARPGATV